MVPLCRIFLGLMSSAPRRSTELQIHAVSLRAIGEGAGRLQLGLQSVLHVRAAWGVPHERLFGRDAEQAAMALQL